MDVVQIARGVMLIAHPRKSHEKIPNRTRVTPNRRNGHEEWMMVKSKLNFVLHSRAPLDI